MNQFALEIDNGTEIDVCWIVLDNNWPMNSGAKVLSTDNLTD